MREKLRRRQQMLERQLGTNIMTDEMNSVADEQSECWDS